jgi:hypothetical protein
VNKYQYQICGLSWASNTLFPLPQAQAQECQAPQVEFTLKSPGIRTEGLSSLRIPLGNIKNGAGIPTINVYQIDQGFLLDCNNGLKRVEFVIAKDGSWIDCYPQPETSKENIELWLFGLVLSFLLQGRGIFCIHASAVDCQGRAIAFVANNGFGKTTLASFFLQQGHSLITDDVLPIIQKEGRPFAMPVYPAMNLWPETLDKFVEQSGNFTTKETNGAKRRYSLEVLKMPFCNSEKPLGGIYFLNPSNKDTLDEVRITPVPQSKALLELLAYTRANSMIEIQDQKHLLKTYAKLVLQVPVRHLEYPSGFEFLPAVYKAVLQETFR